MKVAVVGHVEWIRFARVERLPGPGEIAHSTDEWEQAGGGGGVAAIQLALLADEAHLFTALGDDELGRRSRAELEERGVHVHAAPIAAPQRWAFTHVDEVGERTITTVGPEAPPARERRPAAVARAGRDGRGALHRRATSRRCARRGGRPC